jgi:hypothetical protein
LIRAINEMGFQPLCFEDADMGATILPYVESGLPVILGLRHKDALGHAVTVVGRVFARQANPTNKAADYIPAFIAHDDQAGPYMLVPSNKSAAGTFKLDPNQLIRHNFHGMSVDLNVKDNGVFAVALMPARAFSTAKAAEVTARARINAALSDMPRIRSVLAKKGLDVNVRLMTELLDAHQQNEIVLRTYLTSASGYRRHMAIGTACNELKDELLRIHLPHFTWVTEISTVGSYNQASPGMRRIYGHSVLDATSTGKDTAGLLMLHLPGIVFLRDVNASSAKEEESFKIIPNDALYECREKKDDH